MNTLNKQKSKILVIDDEPDILVLLSDLLAGEGYGITTASGGREALRLFKSESFDLVITDVKMPAMGGMEVMSRAKDLTRKLITFSLGGAPIKKTICVSQLLKDTLELSLSGSNIKWEFRKGWALGFPLVIPSLKITGGPSLRNRKSEQERLFIFIFRPTIKVPLK